MIPLRAALHRGDIVITAFPYTDLTGSKRRPGLVLGGDPVVGDVLLAFISSVVPQSLSAYDLLLDPTHPEFVTSGLKVPSVLRLDKIATVARRLVTRRIGQLGADWQEQADQKLVKALGIDVARYAATERSRLADILVHNGVAGLIAAVNQ